ncbi:hypothetical protein RRP28_24480 [Pseudomonas syringae pv. actinidiae]|nr:hypothetical protein [Pseudomonas syringae]MDU8588170.1 hypothetical protein [Pseudomonas syringae pv. actinidiae]WCE89023.1 hypothetical protein PHA47_25065 [Pseudomonas syringae pv. actinidiae]WOK31519.1 hypothetical protein RRP28_24480 [Pseudomonas syringae pv. actinidiae]
MHQVIGQQLALEFVEVNREFSHFMGRDKHATKAKYGAGFVLGVVPSDVLPDMTKLIQVSDIMHAE